MRKRVRNEPDSGPAAEGAMVTYSRLSRAAGSGPAERQEPFIEARQVPYRDDDLRAYDPDRAASGLDGAVDDLDAPRRGRGRKRRRGGFARRSGRRRRAGRRHGDPCLRLWRRHARR